MTSHANRTSSWFFSTCVAALALASVTFFSFVLISLHKPIIDWHSFPEPLFFSLILAGTFGALQYRYSNDIPEQSRDTVFLWLLAFLWGIPFAFLMQIFSITYLNVIHPLYEQIIVAIGASLGLSLLAYTPLVIIKPDTNKNA
jgi:FtsH-binding integral membrane protein